MAGNGNGKWMTLPVPGTVLRETEKAVLATLGSITVLVDGGDEEGTELPFSTWLPKSAIKFDDAHQVMALKARYLTNRYRNTLYGAEPVHDEPAEE